MTWIIHGRCKSGRRWFWIVAEFGRDEAHKCDDPVCIYGGPHEYGWEDSEDLALKAMTEAVGRLGGEVREGCYRGNAPGRAREAASALKRINTARRKGRPPKPGATEAAPVEYLYEPWSWTDYDNYPYETHKGVNEIPIVKKTAKRIYYDNTDRWDRESGVITLGYIDRQEFETDTRCQATCAAEATVTRCSGHRLGYPHCVHVYAFTGHQKTRYEAHRANCPDQCPLDTTTVECARHGYTWEHCPHGHSPENCWHGAPAGVGRLPDSSEHYGGGTVYATRKAAESALYHREREQQRKRREREPELRRLRTEMANAHPDRGGTNEGFIAARDAYERALRQAS